jgi:hypothetical protein
MAAVIPPPPTHNNNGSLHPTSRAVDRSVEFLSAARTALRISQQRHQRRRQQSSSSYHNDDGDDGPPLPEWLADLNPADLHLYRHPPPSYGSDGDGDDGDGGFGRYDAPTLVRDSQSLLSLLDSHLSDLHALVRRRGHTNDPTIEIQGLMERFQEGAREVKDVCDSLRLAGTRPPRDYDGGARSSSSSSSSSQRRKHYEMLSLQLEAQARERTDALKRELETRSRVLRDQSHRRKLLASGGGRGGVGAAGVGGSDAPPLPAGAGMAHRPATRMPAQNGAASLSASSSQFRSPLFTATSGGMVAANANANATARRNAPSPSAPSAYPAYAGYGGSSSASASAATAGYGGASTTSAVPPAMGMRQRRQQQGGRYNVQIDSGGGDENEDKYNKSSESSSSMQQQISQRREQRATHARAQQARIAERSIAELGVMFTKMSTLISQQGEALERIEDDVEAAGMDIDAGHNELVKVYGMTKGNRGLILKVFGILIFLIIFFKLY